MTQKILMTAEIKRVNELIKECVALNCHGVIWGIAGTGKTTALLNLENKYSNLGLPGRCLYHRCTQIEGPTRGVKNILVSDLNLREGLLPIGMTLQIAIKIALKQLSQEQIRVILLDEADSWSHDSIQGVIAMADICSQKGHPVTLIFSGITNYVKWLGTLPSAISRTLRVEKFEPLPLEMMVSVLREIGGENFVKFAEKIEMGDKDSIRIAKHIHKTVGQGNWRRLRYFTQLYLLQKNSPEVTMEAVSHIFRKMMENPEHEA